MSDKEPYQLPRSMGEAVPTQVVKSQFAPEVGGKNISMLCSLSRRMARKKSVKIRPVSAIGM